MGKARSINWTEEQREFLKENSSKMNRKELQELFNKTFNVNFNYNTIRNYCVTNGWLTCNDTKFKKGHNNAWAKGLTTEEFKKHYTEESFKRMTCNLKQYKERKHKVGDVIERHKSEGLYIIISTDENIKLDKRIKNYARYLYEKHHNVTLKDDEVVIFLDGNKRNYDIKNLIKINKTERFLLNMWKSCGKGIVTEAMLEIIKTKGEMLKYE